MKNIIILSIFVLFSLKTSAQTTDQQFSVSHQGFLAFSLFDYNNWQGEINGSVSMIGNYQVNLEHGKHLFKGAHELFAELGFQRFQGKAIFKYADKFYLDNKFSLSFAEKAAFTITSNIESQFLPNYALGDTLQEVERTLKSSFLTPAFWTLGGAISLTPNEEFALHFSMLSTRMTYLRAQNELIIDDGSDIYLYGLSIGKKLKFDLGLNLELDIDKEISDLCSWQIRSALFFDYVNHSLSTNTRNQLTFHLSKYFKFMINTDLVYTPKDTSVAL